MKEKSKTRNLLVAVALVLVVGVAIFLVACGNNSSGNNVTGENSNPSNSSNQQQGSNSNGNYDGLFLGWGSESDNLTMDASGTNRCWLDADLFVRFNEENQRSAGDYAGQELTLQNTGSSDPGKISTYSKEKGEYPGYGIVYSLKPQPSDYELSYDGGTIESAGIFYSTERGILTSAEFKTLQ